MNKEQEINHKKQKKGAALVEVLVVLGIISTTLVISITSLVNSMIAIRVNEITDNGNLLMIKTLEIAKSPSEILTSDQLINERPINTPILYRLVNEGEINLLEIAPTRNLIETCDAGSGYIVPNNLEQTSEQNFLNVPYCIQVEVIPRTSQSATGQPNSLKFFEISSRMVFKTSKGTVINSIKGFRYDEFEVVTQ